MKPRCLRIRIRLESRLDNGQIALFPVKSGECKVARQMSHVNRLTENSIFRLFEPAKYLILLRSIP